MNDDTGPDTTPALGEADLRRLNWALAAYARCSAALIHSADPADLVTSICEAIVGQDDYVLAAVGLAESGPGKPVRLLAAAGKARGYLDGLNLSWDETLVGGSGPTGRAIRSGEPLIMRDALADAIFTPWRGKARLFGIRSSVTVPFKQGDQVIGVILVYAGRANAFGPRELELFCELGAELVFAMSVAESRARLAAAEVARRAAEDATREAQADLTRAGRLLSVGEFASSIAHELNQPVAAIITNGDAALRWMDRDQPDLAETRAALKRMIRDAHRASAVITRTRGLLAKHEPNYETLDINSVVREVLAFTRGEQGRARVTVQTELTVGLPMVRGDRVQLQQVLLNLVLNALDAMADIMDRPRALKIRSSPGPDGGVRVEVEDSGRGLDPDGVDRLFDHFFTTKAGGVGLGLPISRSIIEASGGRMEAQAAPTGGALFQFSLPAAGEAVA